MFYTCIGGKPMAKKEKVDEKDKVKVKNPITDEERMQKIWTVWNLVEAGLLFVAGILAIVFGVLSKADGGAPLNSEAQVIENVILYVLASFIILDGLLRTLLLAKNFKHSESSAYLVGGFEITIGIVLMIMGSGYFFSLIINFLAVFMIVTGCLFLVVSIVAILKKVDNMVMPILEIVFGAIMIGFGIALLVLFHAGDNVARNRISFILIGSVMAIAGLAMAIITIIRDRKRKKLQKEAKGEGPTEVYEGKENPASKEKEAGHAPENKKNDSPKAIDVVAEDVKVIDHNEVKEIPLSDDHKE